MSDKTTFTCAEAIDISHAQSIHDRLLKSMHKSLTIEVKADRVVKADTAGLQVFVSLINEVQSLGGKVIWRKPSAALLQSAALMGVTDALGLHDPELETG